MCSFPNYFTIDFLAISSEKIVVKKKSRSYGSKEDNINLMVFNHPERKHSNTPVPIF